MNGEIKKAMKPIVEALCDKAGNVQYGQVSVMFKAHNGRITTVTYSETRTDVCKGGEE